MKLILLSEICEVSSGGTPSRAKLDFYRGEIPWAKISDIENAKNGILYDTEEKISIEGLKSIRNILFPAGTLLFAMYGSIGKVAIAGKELSTNQAILGIRPKRNAQVNVKYLKTWFEQNKQMLLNQGRGVALQNLSATIIRSLKIPLPPLNDQIRIATILTRAENLITKRKESIKALDELLKSTFLEMFGDGSGIPTMLGDVIEIQSGQINPKEKPYSEMYHVGGANIESGTGNLINLQQAKSENLISGKYLFSNEYLLYSKIRPYLNKVGVPAFTGICSADIYPIKPKKEFINKQFLRFILMSKQFLGYTKNNSDRANIPKINRKALILYSFMLPSLSLQSKFAAIVEKAEIIKVHYQQSLAELENLYGSLSQRAFKGELDVSKIPADVHSMKRT
ncbi:MAG: restriction endonuclease subunit S [Candidatus Shapirobacteria bacterium]|jgi:type I restriction enzyme S subunit